MSTTAQEALDTGANPNEGPAAAAQTAQTPADPPAAPQAAKSDTREYTLFEETRKDNWAKIGTVTATTQEAAIDSLGQDRLVAAQKENKSFMAIASTYVQPKKPKVQVQTTITYD
jgi:hypothetical protein